jgi:hypothetical protein
MADLAQDRTICMAEFTLTPQQVRLVLLAREVVGARCAVLSSLYTAELVTPSRLVVPNFGPQSPEISLNCAAGELSGSGTARIFTRWQGAPGYGAYPWGGFYRPYAWGWYDGPGYPVSDYPDLHVVMRPTAAAQSR